MDRKTTTSPELSDDIISLRGVDDAEDEPNVADASKRATSSNNNATEPSVPVKTDDELADAVSLEAASEGEERKRKRINDGSEDEDDSGEETSSERPKRIRLSWTEEQLKDLFALMPLKKAVDWFKNKYPDTAASDTQIMNKLKNSKPKTGENPMEN